MSTRNAQRRHAKATQRKKILEQRRRLEPNGGGGLAHEVRRAAAAPLYACLAQDSIFQTGVGMVFLSRKTGARDLALGGFLVDAYCLGVKDAMFRELDEDEMEELLDGAAATAPLTPVDPPYARKLLRDVTAYAQSLGLPPHADYATVEPLFGDVAADACDVEFEFGYEGRPLYVPGRPNLQPRSGGESSACVDGSATTVSTSACRKTRSTRSMSLTTTKRTTIPTSAPIPQIGLPSRRGSVCVGRGITTSATTPCWPSRKLTPPFMS